ncbi:hypothetical protein CO2235_MP100021 [Cupriavidus oxalaticus]|uniref:Uncharacterized protein n=1 Tax=Cupriavidus oxalaticus TaxID=96344 RepID=A0A976BGQ2_9BURK|nr:hypothetical protein CO2235_MP100021 [Cupriavidus oxalaticus]
MAPPCPQSLAGQGGAIQPVD